MDRLERIPPPENNLNFDKQICCNEVDMKANNILCRLIFQTLDSHVIYLKTSHPTYMSAFGVRCYNAKFGHFDSAFKM